MARFCQHVRLSSEQWAPGRDVAVVTVQLAPARLSRRRSVTVRADGFLGSPNNLVRKSCCKCTSRGRAACRREHCGCGAQIVLASTTLFLAAGRYGLTPSANRLSTPGLKLVQNSSALQTGDPDPDAAQDAAPPAPSQARASLLSCLPGNLRPALARPACLRMSPSTPPCSASPSGLSLFCRAGAVPCFPTPAGNLCHLSGFQDDE